MAIIYFYRLQTMCNRYLYVFRVYLGLRVNKLCE